MCISIRQPTPSGQLAAGGPQRRLDATHEAVVAVLGQLALALAVDGQFDLAAAPAADLHLDLVRQREGEAQAVVAGAQVRGGCRDLDGDPATIQLSQPVRDHVVLPYQPSATATAPTDASASRNGGT